MRERLIWLILAALIAVPIALAATSPFHAWRGPVYIAAGFAGIFALTLLLLQPLLIGNNLPNLAPRNSRTFHRIIGSAIVFAVLAHVVGLWLTSPPDVIDVLLFRSPTPFSNWGVIAMWAVFLTAVIAATRRRLFIPLKVWRVVHISLALIIATGTVVHAMLIEGAMETISKTVLCAAVLIATVKLAVDKFKAG